MKNRKKVALSVGAVLIISALLLFAMYLFQSMSLSEPHSRQEYASSPEKTEPAAIRFAWWGSDSRHAATLTALELFEKNHPNLIVSPEYQGYQGYHDKLLVQLSAKTAPDLFQLDPESLGTLVVRGQVEPLKPYVQQDLLSIKDINESNLFDGKYKGDLYGIPLSIQTFTLVYNKNLFDKAGVSYPEDTWTWQDFEDTLMELKETLPQGVYPSYDMRSADMVTMLMVHQQGGAYLTRDYQFKFADEIRWPLSLFQQYARQGLVTPIEKTSVSSQDTMLVNEEVAIISSYNAMATTLQNSARQGTHFGLVSIPSSAVAPRLGSYVKGDLLILINSHSPVKQESVTLLDALINQPDVVRALGLTRGLPPNNQFQKEFASLATGIEQDIFRVQRQAALSADVPEPRYVSGWNLFIKVVEEETQEYAYGEKTLEDAIEAMEARFGEILLHTGE